jgi:hypothetical protein
VTTQKLATPTGLSVTTPKINQNATIQWNSVSNATGNTVTEYEIYSGTSASSMSKLTTTTSTSYSYTNT